ncbi:hypothetical protein [Flexibacterium corallicola]|uniref:hypothetical protein n=1 Tax=Flexibacterium corallicola TaxID=3037259 RepID=UPI00286EE547|nr:hypothetical protein [Pseudovibrio sp. M1P-2-3]
MPDKSTEATTQEKQTSGVIARLKAHRKAQEGDRTVILSETGVTVTFPKFIKHGDWGSAMRMAKNKHDKAQVLLIVKLARFDGEKITETDYRTYIPFSDSSQLLGEFFGGEDELDEDELEGNEVSAKTA